MNKIRILGFTVLLCGIAINLIFANEVADIIGAVLTGLGKNNNIEETDRKN